MTFIWRSLPRVNTETKQTSEEVICFHGDLSCSGKYDHSCNRSVFAKRTDKIKPGRQNISVLFGGILVVLNLESRPLGSRFSFSFSDRCR